MYCSHLSALKDLLDDDKIEKLEDYFAGLIGGAGDAISVSKVVSAIEISPGLASKVLTKCVREGILKASYVIRCPECNMLIKRVESPVDIPNGTFECYSCNEEIEVTPKDIEILYSLTDDRVFTGGQQVEMNLPARAVVPENSMESIFLAGGVNEYLFHLSDEKGKYFSEMYERVKNHRGTTKDIGDSLERLVEELFNICPVFCATGIRTSTNQIDCYVRNKVYLDYGVLGVLGARFIIECKNEKSTPKGEYLSKIHSIISVANAGSNEKCVKFGIIVSKKKGPATFKQLAVKYYLVNKIVIIAICGDELKELFDMRGNLLELIERKATEIMLDATTDLKKAGLFNS